MKHTRLTDDRFVSAAKEILGTHYFESDEDFLDWANDNYYGEASSWEEFARDLVASDCWHDVPPELEFYLDYELLGNDLSHDFYMAEGLVFSAV